MSHRILLLFKQDFSQSSVLNWSLCILFRLVTFVSNWDPYNRWQKNREYVIFRFIRQVLFIGLISIPMTWLNFVVMWFNCFDQSRCSSRNKPIYFAVLVDIKHFPSNLNLQLWLIFFELGWEIIVLFL